MAPSCRSLAVTGLLLGSCTHGIKVGGPFDAIKPQLQGWFHSRQPANDTKVLTDEEVGALVNFKLDNEDPICRKCHNSTAQALERPLYSRGGESWNLYPYDFMTPGRIPSKNESYKARFVGNLVVGMKCKIKSPNETNIFMVQKPQVELFLVDPAKRRTDASIIIAPGGSHQFLAYEREGTTVAEWLNKLGISVFLLKHRVPSTEDDTIMDVQRAVSVVRSKAASVGLNPKRVGFMGFSSAGFIGARAFAEPLAYQRLGPVDDFGHSPDFQLLIYAAGPHYAGDAPPPTFMVNVQDDPCIEQKEAEQYCDLVRDKGQECQSILYPTGGHGFGTCQIYNNSWYTSGHAGCTWTQDAEAWLKKQVPFTDSV